MGKAKFYQAADTSLWFSFAFATNEINRPATAADQANFPSEYATYLSMVAAAQTPTAAVPVDTVTIDPQAEFPQTN